MNLAALVLATARSAPDRVCLRSVDPNSVDPNRVDQHARALDISYGELAIASRRVAAELRTLGVRRGDRVVVQVDKSVEAVALYLAVLRVGAVFVPLNVAYTSREVQFFVEDAEPTLVVADDSTRSHFEFLSAQSAVGLAQLEVGALSANGTAPAGPDSEQPLIAVWHAAAVSDADLAAEEIAEVAEDDLAAILYTSGTTGRSKGAMLTHGNLVSNAKTLCDIWQITADDVLVHVLPIFHVHGLFVALNTVFSQGGQVLFLQWFDAGTTIDLLPQATLFMGVPTHYTRLLQEPSFDADVCLSMRLFTSGSAPLDPVTFDAFTERTGRRILERYGMTEAGMITSNPYSESPGQHGADPTTSGFVRGERVAGTVGYPLPGVEVVVVDDDGQPTDDNAVGILRARGPNVFKGYWRLAEKTAEAFTDDGWLISGDMATRAVDGRISLVGRSTDMIIVGGYNVYPREIEDCLLALDGVAEAAVFGVAHPVMGEGVVACLVAHDQQARPSRAQLEAALKSSLADFKRPRVLEWESELPRNAMGKVQKTELKRRYADVFGGGS